MTSAKYNDYAIVMQRILAHLSDMYRTDFQIYLNDDNNEGMWTMLAEDVEAHSDEVVHLTRIFDMIESWKFSDSNETEGKGYKIATSMRNNLFTYPAFHVALANVPRFGMHGICYDEFIFAADDQSLERFLTYMQKRQRENDQQHVMIFTDTKDEMEQKRELITRAVSRDEVTMEDALKTNIFRMIDEFFSHDRVFFQTYRIPYKRGILLYGKPGNGKTTLVKSIAGSTKAPVAYWQITEYTNSSSIEEVFAAAVRMAPMVLVIEDIDSMPERARSYFLNVLDGATSKEGIFLIGTTNYPEKIDPALMNRAGRFDRAYEIKLPNEELRLHYLFQKQLNQLIGDDAVVTAARQTKGFSFAQLNEFYVSAALQHHYDQQVNCELLIQEMNQALNKSRTHTWHDEQMEHRVGFITQ